MSTALIRYIGKQQPRRDDVRPNSGRIWKSPGAVLRIPEDEKFSYLAHPSEWIEVHEEQLRAEQAAEFQAKGGIAAITEVLPALSSDLLKDLRAVVDQHLKSRNEILPEEPKPNTEFLVSTSPVAGDDGQDAMGSDAKTANDVSGEAPNAGLADAMPADIDSGTAGALNDKVQKLLPILRELDPNNPEHYTKFGKPRLTVIKDHGVDATQAEVEAALAVLTAQQAGGAA